MTNHIHKYFKFHKQSPLHISREWRVCIGAEREYSLSLLTQQQPAPVQHLMPAFIVETAYKFATCSYDPYQAHCTMRFQKKRAKNDGKLRNSAFLQLRGWVALSSLVVCRSSSRLVTPPLIYTISCFRPCNPYIFCEDMILAMCHGHHMKMNDIGWAMNCNQISKISN